jgi:DNA ligase-4
MDSLGETLDAVVIGGYWGQGGRGGILASYMIGLRGQYNGKEVCAPPVPSTLPYASGC